MPPRASCRLRRSPATCTCLLADYFCQQARVRVDALFHALWDNTDAADKTLSAALFDGKYAWLNDGIIDPTEGTGPWIADESVRFGPRDVARGASWRNDRSSPR